jgi:hypothetical protein
LAKALCRTFSERLQMSLGESRQFHIVRAAIPELEFIAHDGNAFDGVKMAVFVDGPAEHGSVRQHYGTQVRLVVIEPSVDSLEQVSVGFIVKPREASEPARVAVYLQQTHAVLDCLPK